MTTSKDTRELAARALCRRHGLPEDLKYDGKPTWMSFLRDVDVVLETIGWMKENRQEKNTKPRQKS